MNEQGELYSGQVALWDAIREFSRHRDSQVGVERAVVAVENAIVTIKATHTIEQQRTIDDLSAKLELALAACAPQPEPASSYATAMVDETDDVSDALERLELKELREFVQEVAAISTGEPGVIKLKEKAQLVLEHNG